MGRNHRRYRIIKIKENSILDKILNKFQVFSVLLDVTLKIMKILESYLDKKYNAQIRCECDYCNKEFTIAQRFLKHRIKKSKIDKLYCSGKCQHKAHITKELVTCKQCGKEFYKVASQVKKHPNNFCCSSCAATYNNTHKTKGYRRSKLELFLEKELNILYPKLEIHYSRKDTINSELDIYIPSLKLAVELNGIFHYEPIYGEEKLKQTQNNDNRKFQACLEKGIELCIIDTSGQKRFTELSSKPFLEIIVNLINTKLSNNKNVLQDGILPTNHSGVCNH